MKLWLSKATNNLRKKLEAEIKGEKNLDVDNSTSWNLLRLKELCETERIETILDEYPHLKDEILKHQPTKAKLSTKVPWLSYLDIDTIWEYLDHITIGEDVSRAQVLGSKLQRRKLLMSRQTNPRSIEELMEIDKLFSNYEHKEEIIAKPD